jgi:hypothetical protein
MHVAFALHHAHEFYERGMMTKLAVETRFRPASCIRVAFDAGTRVARCRRTKKRARRAAEDRAQSGARHGALFRKGHPQWPRR